MKTVTLENTPLLNRLQRTIYFVKKENLKQSAETMAIAFHDDPAIRYLLSGETTGNHDWRYFFTILQAVYGKCLILPSDQTIQNLLVMFPPHLKGVLIFRFFLNGGIGLCRFFGPKLFLRSLNYEKNCQRIKDRFLTPNTWYCMCFAVRPEKQGQGIGSRLTKQYCKRWTIITFYCILKHTRRSISTFMSTSVFIWLIFQPYPEQIQLNMQCCGLPKTEIQLTSQPGYLII